MALLERVSILLRANVNDLIDKAEDPEKTLRQLLLDMENQLLQVKTQVAIAIADQHLLEKKQKENREKHAEWVRKAEVDGRPAACLWDCSRAVKFRRWKRLHPPARRSKINMPFWN